MEKEVCTHCNTSVKDKYTLKTHLVRNKSCLKIRGLSLTTTFICKGCEKIFSTNLNLMTHIESCKKYNILEATKELQKKITDLEQKEREAYIRNELLVKELKKNFNKTLSDAHQQIENLQKMLENLASKAIDKPTTTNTTINQIRNCFSDKYFVEDIKESDIKRKCQSILTEQVLLEGQRGIARMCTEYIINTKDNKKLLIATDPSRNKFRYMDKNGNMKDDIEARTFIEKVSKPIKEVAGIVFDNVLSNIKDEQDTIEDDDYSRKAYLHDKEIQANCSLVYIKFFDDPKHNSEFTNELAILNKNK